MSSTNSGAWCDTRMARVEIGAVRGRRFMWLFWFKQFQHDPNVCSTFLWTSGYMQALFWNTLSLSLENRHGDWDLFLKLPASVQKKVEAMEPSLIPEVALPQEMEWWMIKKCLSFVADKPMVQRFSESIDKVCSPYGCDSAALLKGVQPEPTTRPSKVRIPHKWYIATWCFSPTLQGRVSSCDILLREDSNHLSESFVFLTVETCTTSPHHPTSLGPAQSPRRSYLVAMVIEIAARPDFEGLSYIFRYFQMYTVI